MLPDNETIHRRIPLNAVFTPSDPPRPPWQSFRPRDPNSKNPSDAGDVDGISVDRAQLRTAQETSRGHNGKECLVVALQIIDVRNTKDKNEAMGMDVVAKPTTDNLAHAVIPQLNTTEYKTNKSQLTEWAEGLASKCIRVFP